MLYSSQETSDLRRFLSDSQSTTEAAEKMSKEVRPFFPSSPSILFERSLVALLIFPAVSPAAYSPILEVSEAIPPPAQERIRERAGRFERTRLLGMVSQGGGGSRSTSRRSYRISRGCLRGIPSGGELGIDGSWEGFCFLRSFLN